MAPIVESVNEEAAALVADGADLVVMLVHEGAASTDCTTMDDPGSVWSDIVNGVSADVDAIVSGHTHLAYNCSFPVQAWIDESRTVTDRPVVSAGQYGTNLNQLVYTVDGATGVVSAKTQELLPLERRVPPSTRRIRRSRPSWRRPCRTPPLPSALPAGSRSPALPSRTGAQRRRSADRQPRRRVDPRQPRRRGAAVGDRAARIRCGGNRVHEPRGLRADMVGTAPGDGSYPRVVTYKQAALVQPFANTLVNMQLTGAQIKTVLEQQWQRDGNLNRLLSRPFLHLGVSEGFEYTYPQDFVTEFPLDNPATPEDESLTSYQAP